jgi:hypothetical protein
VRRDETGGIARRDLSDAGQPFTHCSSTLVNISRLQRRAKIVSS